MKEAVTGDCATRRSGSVHLLSVTSLVALLAFLVAWELALSPLRPGGSWLALKAVPLLLPLRGILKGSVYTHRWATLLALGYFAEGCVRLYSDPVAARTLAFIEIFLALTLFATAIAFVRAASRA